jgi:hypothetical protein
MRFVGNLHTRRHRFSVYDYRYSLKPVCAGCAIHAGQRVIMLRDGKYLGQYKPDSWNVTVKGERIILSPDRTSATFDPEYDKPVVIKLSPDGPPAKLVIGGDTISFFR